MSIVLSDCEYNRLQNLIRISIGVVVKNRILLQSDLQQILLHGKFNSFTEYLNYLESNWTQQNLEELVSHVVVNHTYFYRESAHFEYFQNEILPSIKDKRDIRIWCAGCSTGQEAYTLAMILMEFFGDQYSKHCAGVLATDISTNVILEAVGGVYTEEEGMMLPDELYKKYFVDYDERQMQIIDDVKRKVTFRIFNLVGEMYPFKKAFAVIFCRNVLMYFDPIVQKHVISKFYECTQNGGYLILGHIDPFNCLQYQKISPSVFKKQD